MFYRNTGVIASLSVYNNCNLHMTSTNCPTVRYRDGSFCRRCPGCTRLLSIRSNSILDKQHLDFNQFIWLLHAFSNKNNSYVNIPEYTGLSDHTVSIWVGKLKALFAEHLFHNPVVLGGLWWLRWTKASLGRGNTTEEFSVVFPLPKLAFFWIL